MDSLNKKQKSILFGISLCTLGIILQVLTPIQSISFFAFPINIIIAIVLIDAIIILHIKAKKNPVVQFLQSAQAAITAIAFLGIVSLLMGLVPQNNFYSVFGIHAILSTWYFLFALTFFLITLGFAAIKRTIPFHKKNIWFIINHWGLWLTILTATLGATDIKTYSIITTEGNTSIQAYDENKKPHTLPFAITLHDFKIIEYPAKIAIINADNKIIQKILAEKGNKFSINQAKISITDYYPSAFFMNEQIVEQESIGACPIAKIKIETGQSINQAILVSGNKHQKINNYTLPTGERIVLMAAEPRKYISDVTIYWKNYKPIRTSIEVNKPFSRSNWHIYQYSFDNTEGKFSDSSILQVVYDPWYPFVAIGFWLVIIGALLLIWQGNKNKHSID